MGEHLEQHGHHPGHEERESAAEHDDVDRELDEHGQGERSEPQLGRRRRIHPGIKRGRLERRNSHDARLLPPAHAAIIAAATPEVPMSARSLTILFAAAALAALICGPVSADVVGQPAESCVAGAYGSSCHGGPYCVADSCTTDANCSDGKTCQSADFCVGKIGCAGLIAPDDDPSDYENDDITGTCTVGADDACSTCQTLSVCLAPGGGDDDDGGCQGAGAGGASLFALLALGAMTLWRRRRVAGV